ncbi:MAG: hypothetical protein IPQ18_15065 [Saprospiraceae bacterium]|nr:hypothetical protein [Saprospiraceae bacterium]
MAGQFYDTDVQLVNQYFGQGKWNETIGSEINHLFSISIQKSIEFIMMKKACKVLYV